MKESRLAYSYASALFSLAAEKSVENAVYQELLTLKEILQLDKRLINFLQCPKFFIKEKMEVLDNIFTGQILTRFFVNLLIQHKIIYLLPEIAVQYKKVSDKNNGIQLVNISSATVLDTEQQKVVTDKLEKILCCKIIPEFIVDPELVAGLVVKFEDCILDGSMKTQFNVLREQLVGE